MTLLSFEMVACYWNVGVDNGKRGPRARRYLGGSGLSPEWLGNLQSISRSSESLQNNLHTHQLKSGPYFGVVAESFI